jgi:hypothetical protein
MERKTRIEPIEEYFFPMEIWDNEGRIIPAPQEVLEKYDELRVWLENHPRLPNEVPGISLSPVFKGEKTGYVVATQVIYKP